MQRIPQVLLAVYSRLEGESRARSVIITLRFSTGRNLPGKLLR